MSHLLLTDKLSQWQEKISQSFSDIENLPVNHDQYFEFVVETSIPENSEINIFEYTVGTNLQLFLDGLMIFPNEYEPVGKSGSISSTIRILRSIPAGTHVLVRKVLLENIGIVLDVENSFNPISPLKFTKNYFTVGDNNITASFDVAFPNTNVWMVGYSYLNVTITNALASSNKTTLYFYVPEGVTEVEVTYFFRVKGKLVRSEFFTKTFPVFTNKIQQPKIISPIADSNIQDFLTIQTTPFLCFDENITHKSSDWKICSDEAGLNIIHELQNGPLTKYNVKNYSISNTNLFLFARHQGSDGSYSGWSEPVKVTTTQSIIYTENAGYYANSDGIVMIIPGFTKTHSILILPAKDRAIFDYFGTYGLNTWEFSYSSVTDYHTDLPLREVRDLWDNHQSEMDMMGNMGLPAITHVKSKNADVPNVEFLKIILKDKAVIDSLDTSDALWDSFRLSNIDYTSLPVSCVLGSDNKSILALNETGAVVSYSKNSSIYIIPVRELK